MTLWTTIRTWREEARRREHIANIGRDYGRQPAGRSNLAHVGAIRAARRAAPR